MRYMSHEVIREETSGYIQSQLDNGAYCVLILLGSDFMAVRHDEAFITDLDEVDSFLSEMDPTRRKEAISHLIEKAASEPDRLAIILSIYG